MSSTPQTSFGATTVTPINEAAVRTLLGIRPVEPYSWRRKFYSVRDRLGGSKEVTLLPENIAMMLTIPQVLYDHYDESSPLRPKFKTPETAFDTTSYKDAANRSRRASWMKPIVRKNSGVSPVGLAEITDLKPDIIWTDAIAPEFVLKKRRGYVSKSLLNELEEAREGRRKLSAKEQKKLDPGERLTGNALTSEQRRLKREIARLEKEISELKQYKYREVEVPHTRRDSFEILIPPDRIGCRLAFPLRKVREYIRLAWGGEPRKHSREWEHKWNYFENQVIFRAFRAGVFSATRKQTDDNLRNTPDQYEHIRQRLKDADMDDLAKQNARWNYGGNTPLDFSIRQARPGWKDWSRGRRAWNT